MVNREAVQIVAKHKARKWLQRVAEDNNEMFNRLKELLDYIFYNKKDTYIEDIVFKDNKEEYSLNYSQGTDISCNKYFKSGNCS